MQPAGLLKEMSTVKICLSVIRYISSLCCVLASSRLLHLSDGVLSSNPSYKKFHFTGHLLLCRVHRRASQHKISGNDLDAMMTVALFYYKDFISHGYRSSYYTLG